MTRDEALAVCVAIRDCDLNWTWEAKIASPSPILEQSAVEQVLRLRHAKQAELDGCGAALVAQQPHAGKTAPCLSKSAAKCHHHQQGPVA